MRQYLHPKEVTYYVLANFIVLIIMSITYHILVDIWPMSSKPKIFGVTVIAALTFLIPFYRRVIIRLDTDIYWNRGVACDRLL